MRGVVLLSVLFLVGQVLCGVDRAYQGDKDVEEFDIPFDDDNDDIYDSITSDDDDVAGIGGELETDIDADDDDNDDRITSDDDDVADIGGELETDIDDEDDYNDERITSDDDEEDADVGEELETDIDNSVTSRVTTKILTVKNGGRWGDWGRIAFCPGDSFAVGYDMKIESKVHVDNTALNAIKLICADEDGSVKGGVTSTQGRWGKWVGQMKCSGDRHLSAFDLQVEKYQGKFKDDTAANYVKFKCRCHCGHSYELVKPPGHGYWGTWGAWSANCPKGSGICGIQTKVEKYRGKLRDDTALNDVKFYCCERPNTST